MIGWWIVVSTQSPEERDRADQEARRAAILAMWEDGAEGIRWLEALTDTGSVVKLSGKGYPNRYTARAANVLPLIDQVRPTHRHRQDTVTIHADRIAACPADQVLTIEAWDLS